jgi:hypothetical protein
MKTQYLLKLFFQNGIRSADTHRFIVENASAPHFFFEEMLSKEIQVFFHIKFGG